MLGLRRGSSIAVLFVSASALVVGAAAPVAAVQPPSPGEPNVSLPAGRIFYTNPGTNPSKPNAGFPSLFNASVTNADGTRTSRLLTTYGTGADAAGQNATAMLVSGNDGTSWGAAALPTAWAGVTNAVRLADSAGTIVSVDYEPVSISLSAPDPNPATPHNENNSVFRRWTVNGSTWTSAGTATTSFPGSLPAVSARFQRGILLLGDGRTMLATMYGSTANGPFTSLVRSTDSGVTWTQVVRLADGAGWSETNVAPTSDGRLMAWIRRDTTIEGEDRYLPDLYYTQSSTADGSGAWSAPVRMSSDTGNSPGSVLLANGAAVQGSGRPGNVVRYKYSGTSGWQDWVGRTTIYNNAPTSGTSTGGRSLAASGSSNTLALAPLTANTVLAVGDNCASWGCPTTASGYPHGRSQALWKSVLEVNTDQWGTIDLASKFRRGEISYVDPAFTTYGDGRASLGAYAFDGDVRTDSSVVTATRSVTLRLDRDYSITGFGVHAHLAGPSDVVVQTSLDGTTWTTPAQVARAGAIRALTTPTTARYVRISDPNPVTSGAPSFLNELQIYSTLDGFEANAPGVAPVGNGLVAGQTTGVSVVAAAEVPAADPISARFLRIRDTSNSAISRIAWQHGASTAATFEFTARAHGSPTQALLFDIVGTDSAGTAVTPYHLMLDAASGRIYRYDFAGKTWGSPVAAITGRTSWDWNTIKVTAGASSATLSINGQTLATMSPSQPFSTMTGNQLASSGTEPTGDDWLLDDVGYTRP